MKNNITKIATASAAAVTYLSFALPAFAQNVNPCPAGQFAGLCKFSTDKIGTVLANIVTVILIAAAIISLFFLIFGGIRWITSGGDKSKVESARNTIIAAIIGLIIALLAFFIITIVLGFFGLSLANLQLPKLIP
jgi:hypothetical protein